MCTNGTPVAEGTAGTHNTQQCAACDTETTHYHLTDENTCAINRYMCTNGMPIDEGSPGTHNTQRCDTCNPGYHKNGDFCEANTYTCNNGQQRTDNNPIVNGQEECVSCDPMFVLENNLCREAIYTCSNGTADEGTPTGTSDEELCIACDTEEPDAHHLTDENTCAINTYTCDDGLSPANGAIIEGVMSGEEHCIACEYGHYLNENSCNDNVYTCDNGTVQEVGFSRGATTPRNGEEFCTSCLDGYIHYQETTCLPAILSTRKRNNSEMRSGRSGRYWRTVNGIDIHKKNQRANYI